MQSSAPHAYGLPELPSAMGLALVQKQEYSQLEDLPLN